MALKISTLLEILCSVIVCVSYIQARSLTEELEEKDLEGRLSILNKTPVLSFKTEDGITDCIDIYKQPAFDNPLLKNHKIQMKPSHDLRSQVEKKSIDSENSHGFGISCPDGTVPIRRTTKEDLIRQKSSVRPQDYDPFSSKDPNTYYAVLKLKKLDRPYIFAKGSLNCQNPKAESGEASGAQIWVYGGDGGDGNYISAGWMVHPDLYGDDLTRFTAFWKGDGGAGCANMQCPGFVLTYTDAHLGFLVKNISSYGGPLWDIDAYISQDEETKNWWLATGRDLVPIGYWPKELFSHLGNGASNIAYGGITKAVPTRVTPPMGSGIADCNFYHTAYFDYVQYKTDPNKLEIPNWSQTEIHVDCPNVYTVQHPCKIKPKGPSFAFMYGGAPGVC